MLSGQPAAGGVSAGAGYCLTGKGNDMGIQFQLEEMESLFAKLADTRDIGGVAHGQMVLQLPEEAGAAEKMIQYLKNRKLEVEELDNYVG